MKNADLPANPIVMDNGHPYHASNVAFANKPLVSGLTKREMMATHILSGLTLGTAGYDEYMAKKVKTAVQYADLLLSELEK